MNTSERRRRRSDNPVKALRLLLESVMARSEITSIALVDSRGFLVAGSGRASELGILGFVAERVAHGNLDEECERLTEGTDVMACSFVERRERFYLAALGTRVRRMPEAAKSARRILAA